MWWIQTGSVFAIVVISAMLMKKPIHPEVAFGEIAGLVIVGILLIAAWPFVAIEMVARIIKR